MTAARQPLRAALLTCLLGAAVTGLLVGCHPDGPEPARSEAPPTTVRTVALVPAVVADRVRLPATVAALPERSGSATPSAAARILRLQARVGEVVRAGQVLAVLQMDPTAEAEARKAREAEQLAAREAGRQTRLYAAGVAPRMQLDLARATLASAHAEHRAREAALALARANARLVAPLAGTVAAVNGEVGAIADPTRPLVSIVDLREVGLTSQADAKTLVRLHPRIAGRFEAAGGLTGQTEARALDPGVDPATQRGRVLFVAANASGALRVGMFATVEVALGSRQALRVPTAAAVPREGYEAVFVVKDGHAHERRVRLGAPDRGWREALAGVAAGERVVAEGAYVLADGAPVVEGR